MIDRLADNHYCYRDYLDFNDDLRCEIIDGVIYNMSPAPSTTHQRLSGFLYAAIRNYLQGKSCEVFYAPFDVFLMDKDRDILDCNIVVQPDISIICDESKITEKGCVGAPDFIIEIVSPANKAHDYIRKLNLYNDYKVREYWIVNPENKTITKYLTDGANFGSPVQHSFNDKVRIEILDDFEIDFKEFEER